MTPTTSDLSGFLEIVHRVVWCSLATVDGAGRPRSRVVHPLWSLGADGTLIGRVSSRRGSPKSAHLRATPFASCSYWDPSHDIAVAECHAEWDPEPSQAWHLFAEPEPPLGFDPAAMFADGLDSPDAGIVLLRPWRLRWGRAADLAAGRRPEVWAAPATDRPTQRGVLRQRPTTKESEVSSSR